MSWFSHFSTILNQKKLIGPNYVDYKSNLDIVLIVDGHKYVLTDASPIEPTINASKAIGQQFDH
jgi:hypothetical protein